MIHRILGLQNQGKGVVGAYYCFLDFLSGRVIYSNTPLTFPHVLINKDFFLSLARDKGTNNLFNVTFFLDEFWLFAMDSRNPQYKSNKLSSYALLQSSKMNWNVYTTAQHDIQDDKRLRTNAHFITTCERVYKDKNGYHSILSEERYLPDNINDNLYIKMDREKQTSRGIDLLPTMYLPAKPLFKLFDTGQRIYYSE